MNKILQLIDGFNENLGDVISYLNIAVVGIVCWEIVSRYFFNNPTTWGSDAPVMLVGYLVVLAGGYVQRNKRHVRIDILYSRLGMRSQAVCDVITYFFFCLLIYAIIWHGGKFSIESIKLRETSGTYWNPIVYPLKAAIPIGAFLLWLQMTVDVFRKVCAAFTGKGR